MTGEQWWTSAGAAEVAACRACELVGVPPADPAAPADEDAGRRLRERARARNAARARPRRSLYVDRRRAASLRLPPMECGCVDPWLCTHDRAGGAGP